MPERIKLIWDFYGPDASKIAAHHHTHLKEYAQSQNKPEEISGTETLSAEHSIAFIVVKKEEMIVWRDALKPHRGTLFVETT